LAIAPSETEVPYADASFLKADDPTFFLSLVFAEVYSLYFFLISPSPSRCIVFDFRDHHTNSRRILFPRPNTARNLTSPRPGHLPPSKAFAYEQGFPLVSLKSTWPAICARARVV